MDESDLSQQPLGNERETSPEPDNEAEAEEEEEEEEEVPSREEQLLDVLPLNKEELTRILSLRPHLECSEANPLPAEETAPYGALKSLVQEKVLPSDFFPQIVSVATQQAFVFGATNVDDENERKYMEGVVTCLGRRGQRTTLDLLFTFAAGEGTTEVDAVNILTLIKQMIVASHALRSGDLEEKAINYNPPKSWLQSLGSIKISRPKWVEWATFTLPQVYTALSTLSHLLIFDSGHPFRPTTPPLFPPILDQPSVLWKDPHHDLPITLACFSSYLGGQVSVRQPAARTNFLLSLS